MNRQDAKGAKKTRSVLSFLGCLCVLAVQVRRRHQHSLSDGFLDNAEAAPLLSLIPTWRRFLTWECGLEHPTGGIGSRAVRQDRRPGRRGGARPPKRGAAPPPRPPAVARPTPPAGATK